jgi:beta-mannosidase
MYPIDTEFLNTVREEVRDNVRRLQHHPSIALWAGNNENEAGLMSYW